MKQIITFFLIIIILSCNNQQIDNDMNRPFIYSYTKLNKESLMILREILRPYELENDTLQIDKAFSLNIKLDTSLYSPEELLYTYFIGVKLKPDLYDLIIFSFNMDGTISTCEILPDENIIINNNISLDTDLTKLKDIKELDIPDSFSLVRYAESKIMFRQVAWSSTMYGIWQQDTSNAVRFNDNLFNNCWIFKPEKEFLIVNSENDTLLIDNIDLQGDILYLVESGHVFEIATQTKRKIYIKEQNADNYSVLIKQEH